MRVPADRESWARRSTSPVWRGAAAVSSRRAARALLPRAGPVVARVRRARPVDAADAYGSDGPTRGPGRLARRAGLHARRPSLAAAEPACVHPGTGRAAGAAVGAVGLAGAPDARRAPVTPAYGRRAGRGPVGLADDRDGAVVRGPGRSVGAAGRGPVGGRPRAAARLGGRRVAGDSPGGRREHRPDRPADGVHGPYGRRHRTRGIRRRRDVRVAVGAAPAPLGAGARRRRPAGGVRRARQRRAALRPQRGADPLAGLPRRRSRGVGREQRRPRSGHPPRSGRAHRRAVTSGRGRDPGQRGRVRRGRRGAQGDLQERGAGGSERSDGRPLRQDAAGALRRVRPGALGARLGDVGGQGGGRGPQARHPPGGHGAARRGARRTADRPADLLRVGVPRHEAGDWPGTARSCSWRSPRRRPSSTAGRRSSTPRWPRCGLRRRAVRRCTPPSRA